MHKDLKQISRKRKQRNGQWYIKKKKLYIASHQRKSNQASMRYLTQVEAGSKRYSLTNIVKNVEKTEPLYMVGSIINCYECFGKPYDGGLKS